MSTAVLAESTAAFVTAPGVPVTMAMIKAMEELQELNPNKETASNAMVIFMTLNTGGIQLIPATIIGVLAASGAKNPTAIISTALIASVCGTIAAVTTAKLLQRFFPYEDAQ